MALMTLNFQSQYLNSNHEVSVVLPDKPWKATPAEFYGNGRRYPVLWLLHGTFGDHSDWIRKSNVELYACERDVIVVMPSALNSDYVDWPSFGMGYGMGTYLVDELMPLVRNWLPASARREDNFIAGLSMGGGGVLKYALAHPELFAGAAVLSSSLRDAEHLKPYAHLASHEFRAKVLSGEIALGATPFGGGINVRELNVVSKYPTVGDYIDSIENTWDRFLDAARGKVDLPDLYVSCGTKDFAFAGYQRFEALAKELGVRATFAAVEGYAHEWRFWDLAIEKALDHFGLRRDAGNPF
jgi:putative tributyrin esterase